MALSLESRKNYISTTRIKDFVKYVPTLVINSEKPCKKLRLGLLNYCGTNRGCQQSRLDPARSKILADRLEQNTS